MGGERVDHVLKTDVFINTDTGESLVSRGPLPPTSANDADLVFSIDNDSRVGHSSHARDVRDTRSCTRIASSHELAHYQVICNRSKRVNCSIG